jgi:imidazolonepropionase-like amidohydrolase
VPTEKFFESMAGQEPVEALRANAEMKYVAEAMVRGWADATTQLRNDPANPPEKRQRFIALRRRIIKALFDAGVPVLLGSDSPQIWNAPGFSLSHELETYVAAGLTPYQALATGTRNTAAFFGRLDEEGTIGTGRRADLILLDGNPLTDIANVGRQAGVMVAGRWLPRSEIDRRLAALARP